MKRIIRKIAIALLCVIIFFSGVAGLAMVIVNNTLSSAGTLGLSVADSQYCDEVYNSVRETLEKRMALVAITLDDISDIITEEAIKDAAPEAAAMMSHRMLGVDTVEWRYESDELRLRIEEKLLAYAEANGIEYEDGSAEQVYEMVCDAVSAELNIVPQSYVAKVAPLFVKVKDLCALWYIPMAVAGLALVGVVLLGRRRVKSTVYNLMLPLYFSAFVVYCVSAILYSKDYLAKTVLGNSALQYYIRGIYNAVLSEMKQVSGGFTLVWIVVAIVITVAIAVDKSKRKRRHHHHKTHEENESTLSEEKPAEAVQIDTTAIDEFVAKNSERDKETK